MFQSKLIKIISMIVVFAFFVTPLFVFAQSTASSATDLQSSIDQKNAQIQALQQQISQYQDQIGQIEGQANTLQGALDIVGKNQKTLQSRRCGL